MMRIFEVTLEALIENEWHPNFIREKVAVEDGAAVEAIAKALDRLPSDGADGAEYRASSVVLLAEAE